MPSADGDTSSVILLAKLDLHSHWRRLYRLRTANKKEQRTHGVLCSFLFLQRNDLFYILFDLFSCDGNISAAFDTHHADIGADTKNLHAVLAAGVLFFHFEDVPDVEFLDLHINYHGSRLRKPSFHGE